MSEVLIIAGSESDNHIVEEGLTIADKLNIKTEFKILSAHRDLESLLKCLDEVETKGEIKIIIAVAGLSAALPGVVAAKVKLPVIGVPVNAGPLNGIDALLSIAQMPKGVPVATMAIGKAGMINAIYLASRILKLCK
jgi:phosphoribosylaminoimidazole carboxylase PurE protein